MKGQPTDKTRWGAKCEVLRVHDALKGLAIRLKENGLDDKPALEAAKCLWKVAEEVDKKGEAERAAKQTYRNEFNASRSESAVERLLRENEDLKNRLALQPVK